MSQAVLSTPEAEPAPEPRRRRRGLLVVAALLALVWLAPWLVSLSPLPSWVLRKATAKLDGEVSAASFSLGWFSRVEIHDITWRDLRGDVVLQAPLVHTSRSLLGLLWNRSAPGTIRCEKPALHLAFTADSSNVEAALNRALSSSEPGSASTPLSITVECVEAKIHLRDLARQKDWAFEPVHLTLSLNEPDRAGLHGKIQGLLAGSAVPSQFQASFSFDPNAGGGDCQGQAEALPVDALAPLLRRFAGIHDADGKLDGDWKIAWRSEGDKTVVTSEGSAWARDLRLTPRGSTAPLRLAEAKLPWKGVARGSQLHVDNAELSCDAGTAKFEGRLDLARTWFLDVDHAGTRIRIDVDLARLLEQWPGLLTLHDDAKLSAGRLTVACHSKGDSRGTEWHCDLKTTDLRGERGGKTISIPAPVHATFQARPAAAGWLQVDRLHCESDFLRIDGQGSPEMFTVKGDANLSKLSDTLSQLIDLGANRFEGAANLDVQVKQGSDGFFVNGGGSLKNLRFKMKDGIWREDLLTVRLDAAGAATAGDHRLEQALATIQSGPDTLNARLIEPAAGLSQGLWGAWNMRLEGDLARWQTRLGVVTSALDGWRMGGAANAQATVKPGAGRVAFESLAFQAKELAVQGPGLWLREPTFDAQSPAGEVRFDTPAFTLKETQIRCPTLNLNTSALRVESVKEGWQAAGAVSLYGDIGRLRSWFHDPAGPPPTPLSGAMTGVVRLKSSTGRCDVDFDLTGQNLVVGPPAQPTLREPQLHARGRGHIDWQRDVLLLEDLRLDGALFRLEAQGKLAKLASAKEVDLAGKLFYDLEKLEPMLRPYLGAGVKVAGKDARAFTLAGPLVSRSGQPLQATLGEPSLSLAGLDGNAGAHWTSLKAYGAAVGPAELRTRLHKGTLQLLPVEATVNEGKLRVEGTIRLEPGPAEGQLPAGSVVERARITREMCASALGYAIPALANVTEVEGQVSLALEAGRIPLSDPNKADVKGTFILHQAKIGPGPLVRELSGLLRSPSPASLVKEAHVPFHLTQGRVHHKNLELLFTDFTVRTAGSVGLDGSLDLQAQMPIPPKWIGNNPLGAALAKRTIQLPIKGTVEHPRLDPQALQAAFAQFTRDAAGDLLKKELENGLKKLFR